MAKPSNKAVLAICLKTSDRSCMSSIVKLGKCFLKYSSLVSLTRLVSWLNASEQLCVSTVYKGGISCCLELGGPSEVALDVVLQRGMSSTGSGEGCCCLGLGECSSTRQVGAARTDSCSIGEAPYDKVNRLDMGACPINKWCEATSTSLSSAGLACKAAWQAERKSIWLLPPSSMTWHVSVGVSQLGRVPRSLHPWWQQSKGLQLPRWCGCR